MLIPVSQITLLSQLQAVLEISGFKAKNWRRVCYKDIKSKEEDKNISIGQTFRSMKRIVQIMNAKDKIHEVIISG